MKIEFGPTPDGKHYFFPADAIATKSMRTTNEDGSSASLFPTRLSTPLATSNVANEDAKRTYRRENNDKGFATSFYALDYSTPIEKEAVRDLVETWKQHFNAEHPYAFTGEFISQKYKPFFDKMGAGYVFGPDKMVIREFVDSEKSTKLGYAPALERAAVARELLEEDIHNFDPNSVSVRSELTKLGGVSVTRGSVIGWVIPPGGDLDTKKWGVDKDKADSIIEAARAIAPGDYKNLVDMQISYVIDLGLDEQAFGQKLNSIQDAHDLGAFELKAGLRKAQALYAGMVAENDRGQEENPGADPEHELIKGDNGRAYRSLVTAASAELGKQNPQISLDSVITDAVRKTAPKSFEVLSGIDKQDEDRAKDPSGAYVTAEPLKDLAKKIMLPGENLASVVTRLEAIHEALPEKAKLVPMRAEQPFVPVGPIVAVNPYFVVQQHSGMREGVEFVEFYVHDRTRFLGLIAQVDHQEARSTSISHLFSDKTVDDDKWAKIIERGNPVAIGSHAGVLIAMSLPRMNEIHTDFATATPGKQQSMLVEQMSVETSIARYDSINKTLLSHRYAIGMKTPGKLAPNASVETVASYEANRDAVKAFNEKREKQLGEERDKVVAVAKERLTPLHASMIERAKSNHGQAPFADSRSTATKGSARLPAALKQAHLSEDPAPSLGLIVDADYSLKNLIVVQPLARVGKGDDATLVPVANTFHVYNTNDSIDMFAHRNSEGRIANSYFKKKEPLVLGFSEGHLVVKKDAGKLVGQLEVDNGYKYFKEKAIEQIAIDKAKEAEKQADTAKFVTNSKGIGVELGSTQNERRNFMTAMLKEVQNKVAAERNIPIGKIVVEGQKNGRFSEEEAFNQGGIYVKPADVRVSKSLTGLSVVDFEVNWMVAEVAAVERDVVVVAVSDKKATRIYPLEGFATEKYGIKDSELATGVRVERQIVKGDTIEFAKTGLNEESGIPEYRVEIVDLGLQAGLNAQARQAEVNRRIEAAFPKRVSIDKTQTTIESQAALQELRQVGFQPRQINVLDTSVEGRYSGIIHPIENNGDRFVALVVNAESYQKDNGQLEMRVIRDQDTVNRVFAVRKSDGKMPEAGGYASVLFREGKVAVFEVVTKEELKLASNATALLEELRRKGAATPDELARENEGAERSVSGGR